jgi:hypothetical protein
MFRNIFNRIGNFISLFHKKISDRLEYNSTFPVVSLVPKQKSKGNTLVSYLEYLFPEIDKQLSLIHKTTFIFTERHTK